jgi:SAM-dependent methyltransferase
MAPSTSFYARDGLHVDCYDAFHAPFLEGFGDVPFFVRLARRSGGPVLEGACGTGRVAWDIARAGIGVVGFDVSRPMLRRAEAKRAGMPPRARALARFVRGEFRTFDLGRRRFPLALVPFRAFQALLTPGDQRAALRRFRRHLRPGGRLVLDLFDPRLDYCHPGGRAPMKPSTVLHPARGTRVTVASGERVNDPVRQVLREVWTFTERDGRGRVLRRESEVLRLRWSYRHEMRHLFELEGFAVEAEYADFRGAPPAYGREQVWVLRRE